MWKKSALHLSHFWFFITHGTDYNIQDVSQYREMVSSVNFAHENNKQCSYERTPYLTWFPSFSEFYVEVTLSEDGSSWTNFTYLFANRIRYLINNTWTNGGSKKNNNKTSAISCSNAKNLLWTLLKKACRLLTYCTFLFKNLIHCNSRTKKNKERVCKNVVYRFHV